jgi:putative endonuclease
MRRSYFTYILTNAHKNVLYIGMTNNIEARLVEHYKGGLLHKKHFTSKYNCYYCIWYEAFPSAREAISKEKQLKKLARIEKEKIIEKLNPEWKFLNEEILPRWPPDEWMLIWFVRDPR